MPALVAAQRTADFAIEVQAPLPHRPAPAARQREPGPRVGPGAEEPQQPDRRGGVEVHHADVEADCP
jgi:hypothetical protein